MRRYQSLGIRVLSSLFCAAVCGVMMGACSASGNDIGGPGGSASDSGAAADTSYTYDAGDTGIAVYDSGKTTPYDSGPVVPFDAGPMNDCDLSGSGAGTYIGELASGGDGACNASDDSCASASDCCVNIANFIGGGGSIPAPILALLGGGASTPSTCVAK